MTPNASPRHLVHLGDLEQQELRDWIELSLSIKRSGAAPALPGRSLGMLFFRGSLRTRTSFEAAVHQLGGHAINLSAASDFWELEAREGVVMDGRAPEHIHDAAAVLSSYVDALAIRPAPAGHSWELDRRDEGIHAWAAHARVPVINMESALWHPLQALADTMTMHESLGDLAGKKLAVTWSHAPEPASPAVVHSLVVAAARFGMNVSVAHPTGYDLDGEVIRRAKNAAQQSGGSIEFTGDREESAKGAHVVYARSWRSIEHYGNSTLAASQRSRTAGWSVDESLMKLGEDAKFMHAMPIRRNLEVTDEVLDGPRSLILAQAENRLHSQKAVLTRLLGR